MAKQSHSPWLFLPNIRTVKLQVLLGTVIILGRTTQMSDMGRQLGKMGNWVTTQAS